VAEVFETRWLGHGKVTEEFESAISGRLGDRPTLATNTGTSAIHLALAALGLGPGDEVIVPSLTFVATAQGVAATGARPVLCDVEEDTLNAGVACLETARTERTRAAVPVHYRGLPVEIDPILEWGREHGIRIVEDAAHAFGGEYEDGTAVGARGDVTCFSFDPIKNITTGEGGCIVFEREEERERARKMRVLGTDSTAWSRQSGPRPWAYDVVDAGWRYHMPNFCAAVGLVQLERFDEFRERKQTVLERYQEAFRDHPHLRVPEMPVPRCFPFIALVLVERRDEFMAHMKEHGVGTGVHYIPVHHLSQFADAAVGELPVSDSLADLICSLPLLNDQTDEEREQVVEGVRSFSPS
jgi:dTDP-4-amino-4,6-dideoxygalactose transaminase